VVHMGVKAGVYVPANDSITTDMLANSTEISISSKLPLAGGTMTGDLTVPNITATADMYITSTSPKLKLTDTDTAAEYTELQNSNGNTIIDTRNGTENGQFIIRGLGGGTVDEFGRFDELGRFGVGTSNPDHLLHVGNVLNSLGTTAGDSLSNFRIQSDTSNNDSLLFTAQRRADGTTWATAAQRIQRRVDTTLMGYMELGHNIDALITFGKGSTERVRITGAGNVGIGVTNTSVFNGVGGNSKLVVKGSDSSTNILNNSNASITIANDDGTASNTSALHFARADTDDNPHYAGASIVAQFVETQVTGQYPKGQLSFLTSTASNTAPSEKMRIDSSGNVGIGNTNPNKPLTITADSGANGIALRARSADDYSFIQFFNNAGSALRGQIYSKAAGDIGFTTGTDSSAGNDLYIKNGTGVGIGTASPEVKLEVNGGADGSVVFGGRSDGGNGNNRRFNLIAYADGGGANYGGGLKIQTRDSVNVFQDRITVQSNGNVGIGITNPATKLTVAGDTSIRAASAGNSYKLYFGDEVTSGPGKAIFMEGYYMKIQGHRNEGIRLQGVNASGVVQEFATFYGDANAKASQIILAPTAGNVGIGTNSPSEKLHVQGNILATGTVNASSDISLKDNITPIPNAIDKVLQIRGVTFNRNDIEDNPRQAGIIAQEVEKVLPEVVSEDKDGIKSVAYGNMVGLLIEAIKEQQEQINMLKEKLENK
jgi:hypothetical protein